MRQRFTVIYKLLFIHILLLSSATLLAQSDGPKRDRLFRAKVIAGMNASQVDGDDQAGFTKLGANVGGGVAIALPKNWMVGFELLYSQKGSNQRISTADPNVPILKLKMDYIDIPVLFGYNDKDRVLFEIGAIFGQLVRFQSFQDDLELSDSDEYGINSYKKLSIEAVASFTFLIKGHYGINLRYQYSLNDLRSVPYVNSNLKGGAQRHNYLSIRGMYMF